MTQHERKAWLAERRSGIGGSDAAAVLGVSPWSTPLSVWLDKTGRAAPREETEAMRIGTELEDFVARRYCEATGRAVRRYNRTIHRGCLLGNYDRLVVAEGRKVASHMGEIRTDTLLECETSSVDWNGEVPLWYQTQVQHYMGLAPCIAHADVAVLFLTHKRFEVLRVERDDEVIAAMQERLTAWWDEYVVGDRMPPPVSEDDCKLVYAHSHPGKRVVASDGILEKLDAYNRAKADEKVAKFCCGEAKDAICAFMGDAEVLTDALGKPLLTWRSGGDRAVVDWESLAKSLNATPEQIARYTVTRPGVRTFLPKAAKAA